jgi:hypothetical protein
VFFRWQHLELNDVRLVCTDTVDGCVTRGGGSVDAGDRLSSSFKPLDLFQVGGVIFF